MWESEKGEREREREREGEGGRESWQVLDSLIRNFSVSKYSEQWL